jgi:hypothetical protein
MPAGAAGRHRVRREYVRGPDVRYAVVIPVAPADATPQGAAVIAAGRGVFLVYANPAVPFGERCAQAIRQGRRVPVAETIEIGWFDESEGEVHLGRQGAMHLRGWLGRPVYRNDLQARNNRMQRRSQARRLAMQGRIAEAWRIDKRLGL